MKYSFMSFSCPELSLREALELAGRLGYDGFEPRVASGHAHGIEPGMSAEQLSQAAAVAADSSVKLCCLATSVQLASRARLEANMDEARRALEVCARLGIPRMRVFGGPIDEGCTRGEAIEQVARALDTLSRELGDEDVCLCMETHDSWCEPAHVEAVMRSCRGRHVGVNWDVMHPVLTAHASVEEAFGLLRPYIRHAHVHGGTWLKDGSLKLLPMRESIIDHALAIRELRDMGYDGFVSGEWINWDRPGYLSEELKTLRAYEEDK